MTQDEIRARIEELYCEIENLEDQLNPTPGPDYWPNVTTSVLITFDSGLTFKKPKRKPKFRLV